MVTEKTPYFAPLEAPTFRVHVSVPLWARLLADSITVLFLLLWLVDNVDDLWSWRAVFALAVLVLVHVVPVRLSAGAWAELAPDAIRFRRPPFRGGRISYSDVEVLEPKGDGEVDIAHRQKWLFWSRTVHLKLKVDNRPLFVHELQARVESAKEEAVA